MASKNLTSVSEVGLNDTTYIFAETADGVHKVSSDEFGGFSGIELTQAEYDALSDNEKNNGLYFITDGVYDGKTFKLVDTINYTGSFVSTVSTNRPSTKCFDVNVDKLSESAFAILEHTVNKDWATMHIVNIDRTNLVVWINFYNYYSSELSGTVTIRIYDIA